MVQTNQSIQRRFHHGAMSLDAPSFFHFSAGQLLQVCQGVFAHQQRRHWVILMLGRPGVIERVEIDTAHFKGNYPDRASIEVATFADNEEAVNDSGEWQTLLPESKLSMDQQHYFEAELQDTGPVTHVRMSIYPDGGVSRLRLFGQASGGA